MTVTPVTFWVIVSESDAGAVSVKFTSKVIVPPPAKLPEIVRSSSESASFPISKIAPALTFRFPSIVPEPLASRISEPPSMLTVSHPAKPVTLPETPLNVSASLDPSPPCSSVMSENVPLANVSVSSPSPRLIFPEIVAPVFTATEVFPLPPTIALRPPAPTDAPLPSEMVTSLPIRTFVLIAATFAPIPPVTAAVTVMVVAPAPM